MNLPNVTDLIKVDQTTNVFIINKADSTNRSSKFIENNDMNLIVDQTTNEFTLNNSDSTNLVTKFTEYGAKKVLNVTVDYMMMVLKRVKKIQCIVNNNDNINGVGDNDDEVHGVVVNTTNLSKKKNEDTNNKFVKTIKLLN